ncbi:hypothetical protein H7X68_03795 [Candidatus Saccharibacteria bacterium]|nr:hypothetical protein [Candidatus Saccharibacteria bacterium]
MSIPARYTVAKTLAIAAGLVMTLGVGFTPAQAVALENPDPAGSGSIVQPGCVVDHAVVTVTDATPPGVGPGYAGIFYYLTSSRGEESRSPDSVDRLSSFTLSSKPIAFGATVVLTVKALLDTPEGAPQLVTIDSFTATRRSAASCVTTPPLTSVTPAAPTFVDKAGTKDDTYTVPSTVGVKYTVNGVVVAAGTYPAKGTVTVTAKAKPGFVVKGASSWSHKFTNLQVPDGVVYNPKASITSQCEFADGERTGDTVIDVVFDNSQLPKSTSEIGFELVSVIDYGTPKFHSQTVAAGKVVMLQRFYNSKSGKTVKLIVNALDTTLKTYSFQTKKCAVVVAPMPNKPVPPRVVPSGPTVKVPVSKPTTVKKHPVNSQVPKAPVKRTSNLPVPVKVQTDGGELGTNERGILPLGVGFMLIAGGLVYMFRRREARS